MDNNNGENMQKSSASDTEAADICQENEALRLNGELFSASDEQGGISPKENEALRLNEGLFSASDGANDDCGACDAHRVFLGLGSGEEAFEEGNRGKMLKVWKWAGIIVLILCTVFAGAFAGVAYACESSVFSDSTFFDAFMAKWAGVTENRVGVDVKEYEINDDRTALAEKVLNTTARIRIVSVTGEKAVEITSGSGVIYAENNGVYTVLTNSHVVDDYVDEDGVEIRIECYDGKRYTASLTARDELSDIAILRFESSKNYNVTAQADSTLVKAGQSIIVAGNPLGHGFGVSFGHVSNPYRVTTANNNVPLMTIDASVNPGNSGGGVYDALGNLIALVVSKARGSEVDGIGYAIPIKTVNEVVNDLLRLGYVSGRPFIGITVAPIYSVDAYDHYMDNDLKGILPNLSTVEKSSLYGIYVLTSENGSLKVGDKIISVDGKTVDVSNDVSNALLGKKPGNVIEVVVDRIDGDTVYRHTLQVVLKENTTPDWPLK